MKKLILTSAAILFIGLTSFAENGNKCTKKSEKKCDITQCTNGGKCCGKKCNPNECPPGMECKKEKASSCAKHCKSESEKTEK